MAITSTGDRLTADQARRLACSAAIMPFVMGGKSVIHDQGRARRLFSDSLRTALNLLYPECTADDCSIPAAWTEAHHKVPWCKGGRTRLEDGTFLCPFHHRRAHDPAWNVTYHHDGTTSFTRRQQPQMSVDSRCAIRPDGRRVGPKLFAPFTWTARSETWSRSRAHPPRTVSP